MKCCSNRRSVVKRKQLFDIASLPNPKQLYGGRSHIRELGARFYDPDIGRFISQDSYLGESGTPPSLHRYLYAYGNPTVWVDLYGYSAEDVEEVFNKWIESTPHERLGEFKLKGKSRKDAKLVRQSLEFVKNYRHRLEHLDNKGVGLTQLSQEDLDREYLIERDESRGIATAIVSGLIGGVGAAAKASIPKTVRTVESNSTGGIAKVPSKSGPVDPPFTQKYPDGSLRATKGHPTQKPGTYASDSSDISSQAPKKLPTSPDAKARIAVQGEYIDPLTNQKVSTSETLAADHTFPKKRIVEMPGFEKLTRGQQAKVLNYEDNFQGLPKSINSSKGSKLAEDWKFVKGEAINPGYQLSLAERQLKMQRQLQTEIKKRLEK